MQEFLMLIGAVLAFFGLIVLQLKLLRKHHPNAELLIDQFRTLITDQYNAGDQSNG
jgi:hypothetical protein